MAWQAPKTNWLGTDGVRNHDLNRIEGNIEFLYDLSPASEATTIYVNAGGSDEYGDGSIVSPFKTVTKALSTLPRVLSGNAVSINISSGVYDEDVVISGFSGGAITLVGAYDTRVNFAGFTVDGCVCILNNVTVNLSGVGAFVTNAGVLLGKGSVNGLFVTSGNIGLSVDKCSRVNLRTVRSDNAGTYGLYVVEASHVFITNLTGTGNNWGIGVHTGGIATVSTNDMNSTTDPVVSYSGGRYYTGSQNFAVNTLVNTEVIA